MRMLKVIIPPAGHSASGSKSGAETTLHLASSPERGGSMTHRPVDALRTIDEAR